MEPSFEVGNKAYYPVHGVAEITSVEERAIGGSQTTIYVLKIVDSGLKIMIPKANAQNVGLRNLLNDEDIDEVYEILKSKEGGDDSQTWNRRHREYMSKIKTGSAFEIAEVLRDLYLLRGRKELSFGERRILDMARGLLTKEISQSKDIPESAVVTEIEDFFVSEAA